MVICDRCGKFISLDEKSTTWSVFWDQDIICGDCSYKEANHSQFVTAAKALVSARQAGNLDFHGIGVPKDLKDE